jgi:hypothetical protein
MTGNQSQTSFSVTRSPFRSLVLSALLAIWMPAAAAASPVFFAGTSVGLDVTAPNNGDVLFDAYLSGELSIGLREALAQDGYYSIATRIEAAIHDNLLFSDSEYLNLELHYGGWGVEAGLLSALIEDGSGSSYINPNWKASKRVPILSDDGEISFEYAGYLTHLPEDTEDLLYQGIHAAVRIDPSVFFGYSLAIGGGWEYRYEQLVYQPTGYPEDFNRHDLVIDATGTVDGIVGYFTGWAASMAVSWRKSNAAFAVDKDVFLECPEDRLQAAIDASIFASPHQSWTVDGSVYTDGTWYLSRPARNLGGTYGNDDLLLLDIGISAQVDWTPNQQIYLALTGEYGYTLSNDPFIGGWSATTVLSLTF